MSDGNCKKGKSPFFLCSFFFMLVALFRKRDMTNYTGFLLHDVTSTLSDGTRAIRFQNSDQWNGLDRCVWDFSSRR